MLCRSYNSVGNSDVKSLCVCLTPTTVRTTSRTALTVSFFSIEQKAVLSLKPLFLY